MSAEVLMCFTSGRWFQVVKIAHSLSSMRVLEALMTALRESSLAPIAVLSKSIHPYQNWSTNYWRLKG